MDITGNQTVRLRMPVAAASEIDGSKKKGVFAFSTTDQTVAVCPEDGANFVRMGIHPADAPAASSLGGGDIVLIVQGGILKRTTVSEIGGGGVWQPLDSDLTAIASLTTTPFGRSLLTLADAPSARSAIGAASSADLSGYQPLDSDLTAIAALTTTPFGRSLLALADGPAVRTAIGAGTVQPSDLLAYQPLDSDLTAIAALATTPFGRSLLTVADAAAARSAIGAGTSSFSGAYASLSGIPAAIDSIDGLTPAADRIPYYTGTSSAALATLTSFGRSLLALADGPAVRTAIGAGTVQPSDLLAYQPLDSDLTAIAALTTTPFGRSLLTIADAAAARSAIGAGTSSFSGAYASLSGIPAAIDSIDGLTPAADRIPYYTGTSSAALATLTSFARSLLDDADAAIARSTLGALASVDPTFTGTLTGPTQYLEADEQILLAIRRPGGQSGRIHGVAFHAQNDASAWVEFGRVMTYISSAAAGAHTGGMRLMAYKDGAILQALEAGPTAVRVGAGLSLQMDATTVIDASRNITGTTIKGLNAAGTGIRPAVALADGTFDDQDAATFLGTIGAAPSSHTHPYLPINNPTFTGSLYQDGNQRITPTGNGRFAQLIVDTLASDNLPTVTDIAGVLRNKYPAEFRTIIAAAAADHNHAGVYAPVPVQTSKSGNWTLDAGTTTGILQTSTGTLTLPAASATYASKSYIVTASTALTLTIAGTFCYLDANNSASYWYDTATSVAFAMNGGHASGYRKKIEIWCDGTEWLVKC